MMELKPCILYRGFFPWDFERFLSARDLCSFRMLIGLVIIMEETSRIARFRSGKRVHPRQRGAR